MELIASRDRMLEDIADTADKIQDLTLVIKENEDFLTSFDVTQSGLEDAKIKAASDIDKLEAKMEKIQIELETAKESVAVLNSEIAKMSKDKDTKEDKLNFLKEEDPESEDIPVLQKEIDNLTGQISAKESSVKTAQANVASLEDSLKSNTSLVVELKQSVKEYDSQIAENAQRKKDLDSGELDLQKAKLVEITSNYTELKAMYTEFNTKNKDTIKAFEAQQARRDANIRQEPPSKAYERIPEDAEEKAVSSIVVNEVIQEELQITDEGPEKTIRENAIEAGQDTEFNPDWMSAEEARELTLKSIWSTKNIMPAIKKACLKGDYHLDFESMSNTLIYILQIHGYTVTMIDAADDARSDVRVSWEKLTDKSSK
tara:strand:+ start:381 stop:1496 length:1116 start_codon:yes stop_codon:yes gene_type:complete